MLHGLLSSSSDRALKRFDKYALTYAGLASKIRAEPEHANTKQRKIVLDTKERLWHPYMCDHPMVYNNKSKLTKTCDCPNRPRKFQINLKQRGLNTSDNIGDLGAVLVGIQRRNAAEHKLLKRAMNKLLLFVMLFGGFRDGRPDSSGSPIVIPNSETIKNESIPDQVWKPLMVDQYLDFKYKILGHTIDQDIGVRCLRDGMTRLREALIAFLSQALWRLLLNRRRR